MKIKNQIKTVLFCVLAVLSVIVMGSAAVEAGLVTPQEQISFYITNYTEGEPDYMVIDVDPESTDFGDTCIHVNYKVQTGNVPLELSYRNSNDKVIRIRSYDSDTRSFESNESYEGEAGIDFDIVGVGKSILTISIGNVTMDYDILVVPEISVIQSLEQTGYNIVKVGWNTYKGCDGYAIQRSRKNKDQYATIHLEAGGNKKSAEVRADWNVEYDYRVIPYFANGSHMGYGDYYGRYIYLDCLSFATEKYGTKILSVKETQGSRLKVTWEKEPEATNYEIFCSNRPGGKYKSVAVIKNAETTSWSQKVTPGKQYYYYIVTGYSAGKSNPSEKVCGYVKKTGKSKSAKQSSSISMQTYQQYSWHWSDSDRVFYYEAGGKLYCVAVDKAKLRIYKVDTGSMKLKKYKTITLPKYEYWGGFYPGDDGRFYVAIGYGNRKEKDSKTVIKVISYSSKWKKGRTCNIKGKATNAFKGIYQPFEGGNCRMTMEGSTLYLETCRTMYVHSDGLHHQSNIAFAINTRNMTYKDAREVYCSHSFNQYVKLESGTLYVASHGDAYPRGVQLSIVNGYGTKAQTSVSGLAFSITGATGDNYTGLTLGGMETTKDKVMTCGTSVPQGKKVCGIKGNSSSYKQNVFLTVTDKETGKNTFSWLTQFHPKKSKTIVGETRMVKISDEYIAVLYQTTEGKKTKVNYVVVNNKGKKVYSKSYSGMTFQGGSQPILSNGNIFWAESENTGSGKEVVKMNCIPVLYK